MADDRQRWLRQQVELGGGEAILSGPLAAAPRAESPSSKVEARSPEAPETAGSPEVATAATIGAVPKWLKDAPSIPGDGLVIEPGGSEAILSGPLAAAPRAESPSSKVEARSPEAPETAGSPEVATAAIIGAVPKWLKDAPSIPGDGLVIEPGPWDFTEPRAQLESLEQVAAMVAGCTLCPLCRTRRNTVPGEGDSNARLMFVGEGPGQTEDETGRPFVGAAGNLLDDILRAIEISRERVFIANVVKCRPPKNRTPLPDEQVTCLPYLRRQIELIRPKVLVALGSTAAGALLGSRRSLGDLRGQVHRWAGIPLIVTYHPAALLRNPNWKRPTWDDVRIARQLLDR